MQFSIAIPVYQQAHFITSALESLKYQNADIQLSIMDATPDNSVQLVLDDYISLIKYRRHGTDAGQTAAIQEGWDNTEGDIVAWLCADDYYFPNVLEIVEEIFINYPEVDVVFGNSVLIDDSGQFLGYFPALDKDISVIKNKCSICQPSCFVRRQAFNKIGKLNFELNYIMDWDLWTRLYQSGAKFYFLNEYLSVVRMYPGTKTASRSLRRFFEIGRHLFQNTSILSAIKSLIHFYCYDLIPTQYGKFGLIINNLLNYLREQKRLSGKSTKIYNCLNFGFLEHGTLVDSNIKIYLPWYQNKLPSILKISSKELSPPNATLNGVTLTPNLEGEKYSFPIQPLVLASKILCLELSSSNFNKWHLGSIKFE